MVHSYLILDNVRKQYRGQSVRERADGEIEIIFTNGRRILALNIENEKFFYSKDWSSESMATRKEVFLGALEALELMGYGQILGKFRKDHILITVEESLAWEESDNIMAKNLCLLYQGMFNGLFDILQMDVDGQEIGCVLLEEEKCTYKFDFIGGELDASLVDEESQENVSDFLSNL